MRKDIILAGVGGQGILTIATIIAQSALKAGFNVRQPEIHGMSQRGGAVEAHLRLSSEPIFSDLIAHGTADLIIALEPMEALRHVDSLAADGVVIANKKPIVNIADYPPVEDIIAEIKAIPGSKVIDADGIAASLGNARSMNIVLLGAATPFLGIDPKILKETIIGLFQRKGQDVVDANIKAFEAVAK